MDNMIDVGKLFEAFRWGVTDGMINREGDYYAEYPKEYQEAYRQGFLLGSDVLLRLGRRRQNG